MDNLRQIRRNFAMVALVSATTLLAFPEASVGQALAIDAAVMDMAGQDVIREANNAASAAIRQAEQAGNGLISREASELSVMAGNLNLVLGTNVTLLGRQLNDNERNLLGAVYAMTDTVKGLHDSAYQLKDSTIVNLARLAESVPFRKTTYFVQTISGISQLVSDSNYHMQLVAYGLTPGTENTSSDVKLQIGNPLKSIPIGVSITHDGIADIDIDNQVLAPFFEDGKVKVVPAQITMTVHTTSTGLLGSTRSEDRAVRASFAISLFPTRAATIEVAAYFSEFEWKLVEAGKSTPPLRIGDGQDHNNHLLELRVPGGSLSPQPGYQKLANPHMTCVPWWSLEHEWCDFTAPTRGRYWHFNSAPALYENDTLARMEIENDGQSLDFRLVADLYQYTPKENESVERSTLSFDWNSLLKISLPPNVNHWTIEGRTITKQKFVLADQLGVDKFIEYVGISRPPAPQRPRVTYRIGSPPSL